VGAVTNEGYLDPTEAMLVRQSSIASFFAFASDEAYLAGIGHRVAAVRDSRILPLLDIAE
jgi:hypothetical protein